MLLSKYCTVINDKNVKGGNLKKLFIFQCLTRSLKNQNPTNHMGGAYTCCSYAAHIEDVRPISCKIHKSLTLDEISSSNQKKQLAVSCS